MPKEVVIQNVFDSTFPVKDKYHLKYLQNLYSNDMTNDAMIEALQTKDRSAIENVIKASANRIKSSILLIGVGCVIIDREALYAGTGHGSYLAYAMNLADLIGVPPQTISDAKIIGEIFVDYFDKLKKVGFNPEGNAHKLRFVRLALENHPEQEDEVFKRVASDSFRNFKEWAITPENEELPEPVPRVQIRISKDSIFVDGRAILNFPEGLPEEEKKNLTNYLGALYRIRSVGNEPFIVSTYGEGEQRAIQNFLKKYRQKR